jgi:copper chaperone CopZ
MIIKRLLRRKEMMRMTLEKQPFERYRTDEEKTQIEKVEGVVISMRISLKEQEMFIEYGKVLQEAKISSIIRMLALIGTDVIHSNPTRRILERIYTGKRNNARTGVPIDDPDFEHL